MRLVHKAIEEEDVVEVDGVGGDVRQVDEGHGQSRADRAADARRVGRPGVGKGVGHERVRHRVVVVGEMVGDVERADVLGRDVGDRSTAAV
jgi:hypothetical protein